MIVPFNQSPATRQARGEPESTSGPPSVYLAMAAAQMHEQGRLFEPEPAHFEPLEISPQQNADMNARLRTNEMKPKCSTPMSTDEFRRDRTINILKSTLPK